MEEHNQIAGVSPLELLSARPNIHSARCAGMGLTAWANKHSTWNGDWKQTAMNKAEQARLNTGRGGRVLSTMNWWTQSVKDSAGRSQKPSAAVHGKAATGSARDIGRPSRGGARRPLFESHV
jgi:hypothetical protein